MRYFPIRSLSLIPFYSVGVLHPSTTKMKIIFSTYVIILTINLCVVAKLSTLNKFQRCLSVEGIGEQSIVARDNSNSSRYATLNHQWNTRLETKYPLAYFLPKSTRQVQVAVVCGRKAGIRVTPKSGGHSYEGFSFGNEDTIIIDFILMSEIVIQKLEGTAVIGPGALLGTIASKLWENGFGMPMGQCFSVGIGGHALAGGLGQFQSKYGLAMDRIVEMTMVDAWGKAHVVNQNRNPDLFWALRGVGSGYIGLVTRFKFKLFQATKIRIHYVQLQYKLADFGPVFQAWQNWLIWTRENHPTIYSILVVQGASKGLPGYSEMLSFETNFIEDSSSKPKKKFLLQKVQEFFPVPENTTESFPTYFELFIQDGETTSTEAPPIITPNYLNNLREHPEELVYSKAKSYFVDKTFSKDALQTVAGLISSVPRGKVTMAFYGNGEGIASIPSSATAYVHRDSLYLVAIVVSGKESLPWLNSFTKASKFMDNGESSQSFMDLDLKKCNEYLRRYYGANLNKLLFIKSTWDPTNYFRNPESLPILV